MHTKDEATDQRSYRQSIEAVDKRKDAHIAWDRIEWDRIEWDVNRCDRIEWDVNRCDRIEWDV